MLPDELLSSYLVRLAEGLDLTPIRFLNTVWGSARNLLNQDLDNFAPERIVTELVAKTDLTPDDVVGATLHAYTGTLLTSHNPRGRNPWLLPLTVDNIRRHRHGLQFCPSCLQEDPIPYFRRRWRLAFVTSCTVHGTLLRDRCPTCQGAVHQHRTRFRTRCGGCDESLCVPTERHASHGHLNWQRSLEAGLETGWIKLGDDYLRSHIAFTIVRQIATILINGKRAGALREKTSQFWGGDAASFAKPTARQPFEYLPVQERHRLFELTHALTVGWPMRFVQACSEADVHRSHAIRDMKDPPFAFDRVLRAYMDKTPHYPSEAEVAAAAQWLRSTKGLATYRDLKRLVGESRAAIYRHMDYERKPLRPSRWYKS